MQIPRHPTLGVITTPLSSSKICRDATMLAAQQSLSQNQQSTKSSRLFFCWIYHHWIDQQVDCCLCASYSHKESAITSSLLCRDDIMKNCHTYHPTINLFALFLFVIVFSNVRTTFWLVVGFVSGILTKRKHRTASFLMCVIAKSNFRIWLYFRIVKLALFENY